MGDAELWVSDGTPQGTLFVNDDFASLPSDQVEDVVRRGDRLLFPWEVGESSLETEYYVTDGTQGGSGFVTDIHADPDAVYQTPLGSAAEGWVGWYYRTDIGPELALIDGVGPPVVLDLYPGPGSSNPRAAGRIGDFFYFWATTPGRGDELWRTDGTVAGTEPMPELHPGPASESVYSYGGAVIDGRLVFPAIGPDGDGEEVWVFEPPLFEDGFESGDVSRWAVSVP